MLTHTGLQQPQTGIMRCNLVPMLCSHCLGSVLLSMQKNGNTDTTNAPAVAKRFSFVRRIHEQQQRLS